jgi:hypothetical protein
MENIMEFQLERGTQPAQDSTPSASMALESEPTIIPSILLSDQSIVEQGTQKRTIVGCFDQFVFPQFPATYPRFFITSWVTNAEGTLSELDLTMRIEQKGSVHVVHSSSINIPLGEERKFERTQMLAFAIPVPSITFPTPGVYTVLVFFNGEEVGKRDINVLQVAIKDPTV